MEAPITEAVAHDLPRPLPERCGLDAIVSYFTRSAPLYFFAHSMRGAMHMALNPDGTFHRRGYQAQSLIVERHIRTQGARRVLEIGCGRGFNLPALPAHREPSAEGVRGAPIFHPSDVEPAERCALP